MKIRCFTRILSTLLGLFAPMSHAANLDACGTRAQNQGVTSYILHENIWTTGNIADNQREIARELQEDLGSRAAYNTEWGYVHITFDIRINGMPAPMPPLIIYFNGTTSFEKAVLNAFHVDENKPDPSPCDPAKNSSNNSSSDATGGGSSGGGGSGGSSGSTSPGWGWGGGGSGSDPCSVRECIVVVTQK